MTKQFDVAAFVAAHFDDTGGAPSKRRNKTQSGRSAVKSYHGRQAVQAVGGFANIVYAIYAPADTEMCHVVSDETGWNDDGTPNRL